MPATGATLPDDYFDGNPVQWWITSIPPYYCQNNGAPGMDFSTDTSFAGVSIAAAVGPPSVFTTGVKYAPQFGGVAKGPRYVDSVGNDQNFRSIDDPATQWYQNGSADGDWALQTSYEVSTARYDLPFGPYKLNLTTDSTPYPAADGDIIVITTGSTVLAGALPEGVDPYSSLDTRAFNLIFYSTGSNYVNDLVTSIPENASPSTATLPNYNASTREAFVGNSGGLFAFVAVPNIAGGNLMWWPISYDASSAVNAFRIISLNES